MDTKKALNVNMSVAEMHDPGLVTVSATLNDEQSLDEVKKIILDQVARLATEPPTREEVERARTRVLQGMDRTFANSQQLAMNITEVIADGDWRLLFTNYEEIKRVSGEDVAQVAKRIFKDSNRTIGMFIPAETTPDRTTVGSAPPIDTLLRSYTPDIKVEAGEAIDPSPAAIEKRISRSTLPGGLHLALLPKSTRGNRVQANSRSGSATKRRLPVRRLLLR